LDSTAIIAIIAAVALAVVQIIGALGTYRTKAIAVRSEEKVDVIHDLVNGGLATVKRQLAAAKQEITELKATVADLAQRNRELE